MKKSIFMLTCSMLVLSINTGHALTSNEQLQAMKEILTDTFKEMDTDRDDCLTKDEYLNYQFEKFRASILSADNFDTKLDETVFVSNKPDKTTKTSQSKEETPKKTSINEGINIMQSMADYKLDEEELELPNLEDDLELSSNLDDNIKEDDMPSLDSINLEELKTPLIEEDVKEDNSKSKDMSLMIDMLKSSLPKKIDEITTWIDVEYNNNTLSYIYQADMDTSTFSKDELLLLTNSIKLESCTNAYKEMCPKIKTIFIDYGINMQISYIDKNKKELSSCEFNKETCK